jgi:hypothetical protein
MDAAVAALAGAAIGAIGTLGTTWLQQRNQTKRDLLKSAVDLGMKDFDFELGIKSKRAGAVMAPLSVYVAYHADVLKALADDQFGPPELARIDSRQKAALEAIMKRGAPPTT